VTHLLSFRVFYIKKTDFKIGSQPSEAVLHCHVQAVASGWSVSLQVAWLELLGFSNLMRLNAFQESFCATLLLTSVSQQPFYNYCCSVWRVTLPGFGYSWYVFMSGGCRICVYDLATG